MKPWRSIDVGRAKVDFDKLLAGVEFVTPEVFATLLLESGLSAPYLRKQLLERGRKLHVLIEGVRQDTEQNLERTLTALAAVYEEQPQEARKKVLESRMHLDFALRKDPKNPLRQLVLLHLRTWLENPPVYPLWAALQKQKPPDETPSGFA
jgi:hypothetical protein